MDPKTKNLLNVIAAVILTLAAADFVYVSLFHNKPIIEALEPLIGAIVAVGAGAVVWSYFKRNPVL